MEVQWVYSTNANVKDSRYAVRCLSVSDYITSERYVVDTGAVYTCCNYKVVNETLQEEQLRNIILITNPYDKKIYFCKNKEDYIENCELVAD